MALGETRTFRYGGVPNAPVWCLILAGESCENVATMVAGVRGGFGSNLDDVCGVIGYSATRVLVAWYAGRKLYVPARTPRADHPLVVLIGARNVSRLIDAWGGDVISLPSLDEDQRAVRNREIAEALVRGESDSEIAGRYRLSAERVGQIRRALTESGLLRESALSLSA